MAELADAPDLGSGGRPCRFDSCHPHRKRVDFTECFCRTNSFLFADMVNRILGKEEEVGFV